MSSLKRSRSGPPSASDIAKGFGLENASFKWNEVEEKQDSSKNGKDAPKLGSNGADANSDAESRRSVAVSESGDHRFELRDISVMFPEGELIVITGPTASGKTALLVRPVFFPLLL